MRKLEDGNIRRKREVCGQNGGLESLLWKIEARRLNGFHPPKRKTNPGNEVVAGGY